MIDFEITEVGLQSKTLNAVVDLHFQVLPSRAYVSNDKKKQLPLEISEALSGRQGIVLAAMKGEQCLGYKVAYVTGNRFETLYIWLGGVHPVYRRHGIARALLAKMTEYATSIGVDCIESHVYGTNQAMMILNLQAGFGVCGCLHGSGTNTVRVTMRKAIR